jgi:hypothetical protein
MAGRGDRRAASCRAALAAGMGAVVLVVGACGAAEEAVTIGTAPWGPYDVAVELRPAPPRTGSNEAVVILSGEHHRPVYDALVFVRTQSDADWVQAIEDGHVGVYRRAVHFTHAGRVLLQVRLLRDNNESVIDFPVDVAASRG